MTVGSVHTPGVGAEDITVEKDGGIVKEIKVAGAGVETPWSGDRVFVHMLELLQMDQSLIQAETEMKSLVSILASQKSSKAGTLELPLWEEERWLSSLYIQTTLMEMLALPQRFLEEPLLSLRYVNVTDKSMHLDFKNRFDCFHTGFFTIFSFRSNSLILRVKTYLQTKTSPLRNGLK